MSTFDVELATIAEHPGDIIEIEPLGDEETDITHGQALSGKPRILSTDGEREGWLVVTDETHNMYRQQQATWDFIWDGTKSKLSERLMEQQRPKIPRSTQGPMT